MLYLSAENSQKLYEGMRRIRREYPVKYHELSSMFDELNKNLCEMSEFINREEIEDGKRFGVFTFSKLATAFSHSGTQLVRHGDVYLILWTYSKNKDSFYYEDACGRIHFEKDPTRLCTTPLIEIESLLK